MLDMHLMKADPKSMHGGTRRFADPHVIEFRPRPRSKKPKEVPIIDPIRRREIEEDRQRMQQNLAAAIVLVLVLAAGLWLIHELRTSTDILTCIEAGYRNCLPTDWHGAWIR
jgi:hypothetical protein